MFLEEEDTVATVMDYIPCRQLRHVWPSMSLFAKLRVAFILRGYLRQLRAIRHPRSRIPGPIASDDQIRPPQVQMIGGELERPRAPFGSCAEFSAWWNERYAMSMECAPQRHEGAPPEPFDDSAPLVLTHCDLNMRNILVGDDGRLYLIDWDLSGFYPPWFEYVNWRFWVWIGLGGEGGKLDRTDRLWNILIPFITLGPYNRQERWYSRVLPALAYFDVRRLGYS